MSKGTTTTRNGVLRLLSVAIPTTCFVLTVVVLLTTTIARHPLRKNHKGANSPPLILSFDDPLDDDNAYYNRTTTTTTSSSSSSLQQEHYKEQDIFSNGGGDNKINTLQTEDDCLVTGNLCESFSADCCEGLICVPVNVSESRCSHYKGSICLEIGMICSDAVYGVNCCDNAVCTPEGGGTGRSRCVL